MRNVYTVVDNRTECKIGEYVHELRISGAKFNGSKRLAEYEDMLFEVVHIHPPEFVGNFYQRIR
jgi:hypothetical protein